MLPIPKVKGFWDDKTGIRLAKPDHFIEIQRRKANKIKDIDEEKVRKPGIPFLSAAAVKE
jgi:hypothetical protein